MVDPTLIGIGASAVAVASAAAYTYFTGNDSSAEVDIDGDGDDDAQVNFEGTNDHQAADGIDVGAENDSNDEVEQPTQPEHLDDYNGLTDIKGIQSSRAEKLGRAGFPNPEDIYYASDANLLDISGIGEKTVEMFREDIGGIDYEGSDSESASSAPEADEAAEADEGKNESTDDSETEATSDEEESGTEQTDESAAGADSE